MLWLAAPPAAAQQRVGGGAVSDSSGVTAGHMAAASASVAHNPQRALLLSAVLPGAGQVYNKQAWKLPIVYGALGAGGYFIYDNFSNMRSYKKEYVYRVTHDGDALSAAYADYPTTNIYNMYETYNQRFQLSIIVTVALYGLNCLDAFVFGHLFEFDLSDDLSLLYQPVVQYDACQGLLTGGGIVLSF